MKEFELPVLPGYTPLRSVLAVLHYARRSAVVRLSSLALVHAGSIVHAIHDGKQVLDDAKGEPIATDLALPWASPGGWLRTATIAEAPRAFNFDDLGFSAYFEENNVNFALSALAPGRAFVVSREEGRAPAEIGPQDCYCTRDDTHPIIGPPPRCKLSNAHKVDCI